MRLCACPAGPLRDTTKPDRLTCRRCGGATPHGRPLTPERLALLTDQTQSLLANTHTDYLWAHSLAGTPTRRPDGLHHTGTGDPTGEAATNQRRLAVTAWTVVCSRLLERALLALRMADDAIGEALLVAEDGPPGDHVRAPWHEPVATNRPDLDDAYAARARRHTRGEGIPQ